MSQKYYETEEFMKEQRKWYAKLKSKGFKEIEHHEHATMKPMNLLNGFSAMDAVRRYSDEVRDYFYRATQHLLELRKRYHTRTWQYKAWMWHADGLPYSEIAKRTKKSAVTVTNWIKQERQIFRSIEVDTDEVMTEIDAVIREAERMPIPRLVGKHRYTSHIEDGE